MMQGYPINWPQIQAIIIARDGGLCRMCKSRRHGELHVHHIDWNSAHSEPDNLVTLCGPCHRAAHSEGFRPDGGAPWGKHPECAPYEIRWGGNSKAQSGVIVKRKQSAPLVAPVAPVIHEVYRRKDGLTPAEYVARIEKARIAAFGYAPILL